ncbi:hypothetical protein PVAND_000675 [Polypedilum vanderplanki]|uniref:Glucose-6-phosphatase n=1 Tax=Polypedilum vanderplanki TaxID=319348 RepID=A0A9J6BLB5_POLVA|nr:hypothetical protein PVAND_000675 [Polypedilum vanderplanki]
MEIIDSLWKIEIDLIIKIQNKFFKYEEFLGYFSTFFGSGYLHLYIIPLFAMYNTKVYHRLLISCIATDFINLIIKWILDEDRPYWWVNETKAYTSLTRPILYQTERTCETSGGSPSGHSMIAACFLYIIYDEINRQIDNRPSMSHKVILKILNKIGLTFILTITAISRMYFAAHFLHQCILGFMLGLLVANLMANHGLAEKFSSFEKRTWMTIIAWMIILVVSIYWAHKLISGNPMKTVELAFKHCKDPLYPKPETTVVFSALRCIAMSCGILLNAPIYKRESKLKFFESAVMTICLIILQFCAIYETPKNYKIIIFYSYSFIIYAFFQFMFIYFVPKIATITNENSQEKVKNQ